MDRLEKALQKAREQRKESQEAGMFAAGLTAPGTIADDLPPIDAHPFADPRIVSRDVTVSPRDLERHRIVSRMNVSPHADVFRVLRTKVLQQMQRSNMRTFAITSPHYGDGKTTIALNLALSLAMDVKQTVLLVDLDLRHPRIHEYLGIKPMAGLADYFQRDVPVPQCLVKPNVERLVVLPVNGALENSSELLGTPRMAALARELRERYADRIVIYDMPPLLARDDVMAFLPHVDGVLLVVREGQTSADDVRHCMHCLADTNVIGTVLNDCSEQNFNKA